MTLRFSISVGLDLITFLGKLEVKILTKQVFHSTTFTLIIFINKIHSGLPLLSLTSSLSNVYQNLWYRNCHFPFIVSFNIFFLF